MSGSILRIRGLRIESHDGKCLVDGVDLKLKRGEVLGLIGESGAGKSTIGLASMAYARAGCRITGGDIDLGGNELLSLTSDRRRELRGTCIAYVAQSASASFNPAFRIIDQVAEVPVYHGLMKKSEADALAKELFKSLGLPDPENFGEKFPHEVSGGQLQRAMAAMAIAGKPDVLVFDEPTTALDVTTQIEVLALIKSLIKQYRTAALYISHDLAVVAQLADRIIVLRGGRTVEVGTTEQILGSPREEYTRQLVQERDVDHKLIGDDRRHGAMLLKVDRLEAFHGMFPVLKGVSLELSAGETLAVIGESGSGKSSLARAIVGLLRPTAGRVELLGRTLATGCRSRTRDELQGVQLIYQHPDVALNPRQTVGEAIGRPARFYTGLAGQELAARVEELLSQVGLPKEFAERRPGTLSGGQKQRVCIARALAAKPSVIICDEPTSALDPLVAQEVLQLLVKLQKDLGLGYLFITHDLGVVRRIAHRTMVLLRGEIVASGMTDEVFRPPMHPYTQRLFESVPALRTGWLEEVLEARGAKPLEAAH